MKYFEYSNGTINYLNNFSSTVPQKSVSFFPKRAMNCFKSEMARAVKLTNTTIEYVSFNVPKRVSILF
jgi:coronin-1B/1C/6